MSAPLYSKILLSVEENMFNMGYNGKAKLKWTGDVTMGSFPIPSNLMNFTANAAPVAGDLAFVAKLRYDEVAGNQMPAAMMTQSHAAGYFIQGSAFAELFFEAPDMDATGGIFDANPATAAAAKARVKFIEDVKFVYRGQFGTRIRVYMCPTGTALAVNGVNGAVADSVGMIQVGTYIPYGRIGATGELG
jgi:hypothetical protein